MLQRGKWAAGAVDGHASGGRAGSIAGDVQFATEAGVVRARMYLARDGTRMVVPMHQGLVVLHGVHHLGIDEPRLMGFAAVDGELRDCGC